MSRLVLVLDTASPVVSVALGRVDSDGPRLLATRDLELKRSSERLLGTIDEVLDEAGVALGDVGGIAAVRGPGSFTGLRVGLATALGLHQARGMPAVGLDALRLLARAAARGLGVDTALAGREVVAVVDALRGEWLSCPYRLDLETLDSGALRVVPVPLEKPRLRTAEDLLALGRPLVGFGVSALTGPDLTPQTLEAPPLAPFGLDEVATIDWDPGTLVQPIYFRPPATTPPRPHNDAR